MAEDLRERGVSFGKSALVASVPLSFWRKGSRGFNQAEMLARALGKEFGLLVRGDLLGKSRETLPQAGLSKKERIGNLKEAFGVRDAPVGEDILLVDDVLTTGATMLECSRALKRAGVGQVWIATFAKD
jgi:ComF family protein